MRFSQLAKSALVLALLAHQQAVASDHFSCFAVETGVLALNEGAVGALNDVQKAAIGLDNVHNSISGFFAKTPAIEILLGAREIIENNENNTGIPDAARFLNRLAQVDMENQEKEILADLKTYLASAHRGRSSNSHIRDVYHEYMTHNPEADALMPSAKKALAAFADPTNFCDKNSVAFEVGAMVLGVQVGSGHSFCKSSNGRRWFSVSPINIGFSVGSLAIAFSTTHLPPIPMGSTSRGVLGQYSTVADGSSFLGVGRRFETRWQDSDFFNRYDSYDQFHTEGLKTRGIELGFRLGYHSPTAVENLFLRAISYGTNNEALLAELFPEKLDEMNPEPHSLDETALRPIHGEREKRQEYCKALTDAKFKAEAGITTSSQPANAQPIQPLN